MRRIHALLFAAALLAGAGPVAAETSAGQPIVAVVIGLANGDLLNIRASASPVGTVRGRLPNGATLTAYGCGDINGHKWCKVEDAADPKLNGWAPARYLYTNPDEVAAELQPETASTAAAPAALPAGANDAPASPALPQPSAAAPPPSAPPAGPEAAAAPPQAGPAKPAAPALGPSAAAGAETPAIAAGTPFPAAEATAPETPAPSRDAPLTSEALAAMVANRAPASEAPAEQVALAAPAEPAKPFEIGALAAAKADKPVAADGKATAGPVEPRLPADLTTRFGEDGGMGSTPADRQAAAVAIGKTAILDAYGLAFAARGKDADGDAPPAAGAASAIEAAPPAPDVAVAATEPLAAPTEAIAAPAEATPLPPAAEADSLPAAEADSLPAAAPVPLPSPRPEIAAEPLLDTQTVAQVQAPLPDVPAPPAAAEPAVVMPASVGPAGMAPPLAPAARVDATGEIPCARYLGQPMTRCQVSIARKGDTIADVTVTWPDGGARVISFYGGEPAGSNSRSSFRFTRESGLNMIRVGTAERFEITDAMAFGD